MGSKHFKLIILLISVWSGIVGPGIAGAENGSEDDKTGPFVSGITIKVEDAQGDPDQTVNFVKSLLGLEEGEPFSSQKLEQAVAVLKASGLFDVEEVKVLKTQEGDIELRFVLRTYPRIMDIQIKGSFPISEREVLNAMTVYTGDVFRKEDLPKQKKSIMRLLKNEGYLNPKAAFFVEKDSKSENFYLHVDIEKGTFFHIEHVEIKGNRSFSDARLKIRMDTWHSSFLPAGMSRYIKKKLDEDLKKLTSFYRNKGYADMMVKAQVEKEPERGEVAICFVIEEGPRYEIEFVGNSEFWDWTLEEDLILFREGNRNDLGLRRSVRRIKDRYQEAGYADCKIRIESKHEQSVAENVRKVRLIIEEGPQAIVEGVAVMGNTAVTEDEIRNQILTCSSGLFSGGEFVSRTLDDDIRSIVSLYLKYGYLHVKIEKEILWKEDNESKVKLANIILKISEGPKITVKSLVFRGLNSISEKAALKIVSLKPGDPFREYMVKSDENLLSAEISECGYPHVVVKGKAEIFKENRYAEIIYEIAEGPSVEMGDIHMVGNFRTKSKVVQKELTIKKGEPFSLIKMLETQRNIRNINAFETARIKPMGLKEKADKVNFLVEVEEKKPYSFQVSVGYDTSRRLYADTRIGDLNLFGLNKDTWASLEVSEIGERGVVGITEPRFVGTRISSTLNLFGENREEFNKRFGTTAFGAVLSFKHKLPYNLSVGLALSVERKEQYLRVEEAVVSDESEEYKPRSILVNTPLIVYNSIDSFIRPRKGIFSSLTMDVSKGLENSLDDFIKYQYEIRLYYTFHKRLTFAIRGRTGHIVPFGEESNIPDDQLFFLGGLSDVRGYDENRLRVDAEGEAVGGRTQFLGSIEVRFDVGYNIELAPFFDTGSIQDALLNEGADEFRSSVGISLRYLTPSLPIGLQYGHKLDRKTSEENAGRLYFTIGYTF
ncbi:MAG: outer membrane protein assembly factor BamA [Deltaproteobacteria bacterium]|nr:outer membrane protein assembly factor BamA [Deltaproteobacteria bacterium]